jgi:hypothetical protein
MTQTMSDEPDYTLTIVQENGTWIVFEGNERISNPFEDRGMAESWMEYHRIWRQPRCFVCGSAKTRTDDPWVGYSSDPDWVHKSCMEKFHFWADNEAPHESGPQPIPTMEVLDGAWQKHHDA